MDDDWKNLKDYIRALLKDGKRSQHPDFQLLFNLFGKDKIVEMAKAALEEEKNEKLP